ncbi:HNH endonuclease signature motif containing protein [Arthrobacter sp. zg-Y238]|uniref:HNH endonuclease n=1 Tax=Arthrobacter sp. zg-Y238 TaxID=2964614 RepID=UPI0021057574|nr:HNH endonuclease signature motif containing protein [Arthrobacter sp. zg-Y238]MCQ1952686.1 HNH endonuclease [Arthrobacter sp. zg-Y238]
MLESLQPARCKDPGPAGRKTPAGGAARAVAAASASESASQPTATALAAAPGSVTAITSWLRELSSAESLAGIAADSDAGLIDRLRCLEELKAAASAAQARAAAALDASIRAAHSRAGIPADQQGKGAAAQVALARRESPARGGRILGFAKALTHEMPDTLRALSEGRISEWRATLLVRETACLSVENRRLVDEEIAGDPEKLEGLGDGRLLGKIRSLTYRIDQEALLRRAAKAQADRYVSCRPAPDTMTYLTGLLPVAQGVAVFAALSRQADSLRARGDSRGRGQIMADTMVERITGQARAGNVPVEVQLVMTDRTLLAGSAEPAYLSGYGIVPSGWARAVVRKGAGLEGPSRSTPADSAADSTDAAGPTGPTGSDGNDRCSGSSGSAGSTGPGGFAAAAGIWLQRLYTAPSSGQLIAMDSKARFVPASLARLITARDQTCRTPWCSAPVRHQDHIRPHRSGGTTDATNIQGLCEACNHAKETPGWSAQVVETTPGKVPGPPGNSKEFAAGTHRSEAPDRRDQDRQNLRSPVRERHTVEITTPTGHRYLSTAPPLPGASSIHGDPAEVSGSTVDAPDSIARQLQPRSAPRS